MRSLLLLLLIHIQNGLNADEVYPKCCDSDSVLKKINSSYICTPDLSRRTQIIANETAFVDTLEEGFCIDVEKSVSLFRFDGDEAVKVQDVTVEFFPKCCPVDYFYNSTTHGCVKSTNKVDMFFRGKFVRVGLPHCGTVEDVRISTIKNWNESLQLTQNKIFAEGLYCVDKDQNNLFIARTCRDDCICKRIRCVYKCCPDGQSFINGSKCYDSYLHGVDFSAFAVNVDNTNDTFAVVHGFTLPLYKYKSRKFQLDRNEDGTFILMKQDQEKINERHILDPSIYCIEHAVENTTSNFYLFQTFPNQKQIKILSRRVPMAISCVFLALTIVYYCISDEKQTVFGKIVISYCLALFVFYLPRCLLAFQSTHPTADRPHCTGLAFLMLYISLSIFTWMNMMCIDIYWTFKSSKSLASDQHKEEILKRFMLYSLYAWGVPLVPTALSLIFYHIKVLPSAIQLIVDNDQCLMWNGNYGRFTFSTMPSALVEICNSILLIKITICCLQVNREIDKINDIRVKWEEEEKFNNFRYRFGLLWKLFVVMSIPFLFEVVSAFYDFRKNETMAIVEKIWDSFNCLQGLFIFVIFLVKKRTFENLKVVTKFRNSMSGRLGLW